MVKLVKVDPNTIYPHSVVDNDPEKRGQLAGDRMKIGPYDVYPVHTRFGVVWFADQLSEEGGAELVATEPTFALVIKGLRVPK